MNWLNCAKIKVMLIGLMAAMVLGSGLAKADFTFGKPTNLGPPFSTPYGDALDCITADGLEMYLDSYNRPGGYGGWDIWVSTRKTVNDDWGAPVNLGPSVNTGQGNSCAYISADGLELYFNSYNRSGGYGGWDIWITRRATKDDAWGVPVNLGTPINTSGLEGGPWLSTDGLELYFGARNRAGGYGHDDILVSRRATKNDPWGEPVNLGPIVNSSACEGAQFLSPNGLLLFFSEDRQSPLRPGGFGNADMWVTRRASVADPWGTPVNLGPIVNSPSLDNGPRISPDGSMLYFCSERPGGLGGPYGDIYQAEIIPIVDFNGDGIVDSADMCIMIDHWGEYYPLCDIGPTPLGDGIIDVQDLVVLAEHFLPVFLAHWELDETEGVIAYDSVGDHDGTLNVNPLWQPAGGKVNGALQLDGIDDYVSADFTWNTWKMMISAFAWIKGGAPGQVIISQTDGGGYGAAWLYADSSDGKLVTKLMDPQPTLVSESVITDGTWHHIGLVWDGSFRYLYVDGVEVAKDAAALNYTVPCDGGLYLGVGKTLDAGSFFSGLIDDVRIYNKALTAEEIEALAQ